jgi:alpha-L-arabinofuranosidase
VLKASFTAHKSYVVDEIDPRLYGSFLEHLGRAVYTGIYEPDHAEADQFGLRQDVMALVRELGTPVIRYPGGNFVSSYNWEDGIGPRNDRPTRLDLAWHTAEPNTVGIHEFAQFSAGVGAEMMLAVNLGTRGLDAARNFLEYCNHPKDSYWSDLRRKNGRAEPWNVKLWCLGNEMDGPWQIGQRTADDYGRIAAETGKAMKAFDPALELVVCGSSHSQMPSYPQWEATVLEHTYDIADHISLHMYFNNRDRNMLEFLAQSVQMENYIRTVAGVIDYEKAKKRSKRNVTISFDEWNVWYHSRAQDMDVLKGRKGWPVAPRLLEDIYLFEDVLCVASIINTFIRRADVVKVACIAQLVNVIAPIMTEPGGPAWRQTIFYPFAIASRLGRGKALDLRLDCPKYDAKVADAVPYLDVAAVARADGSVAAFLVNRHETEALEISGRFEGFEIGRITEHLEMSNDDMRAANSLANPKNVVPRVGRCAVLDNGLLSVKLPPLSYAALLLGP